MSVKKNKVDAMLQNIKLDLERRGRKNPTKSQPAGSVSPPDVSSIEKTSFLEDEEFLSFGNPLHSTALEDELSPTWRQNAEPRVPVRKEATKSSTKTLRKSKAKTPERPNRTLAQKKRRGPGGRRPLLRVSEATETEETTGTRSGSSVAGSGNASVSQDKSVETGDSAGPSQVSSSEAGTGGGETSAQRERRRRPSLSSEDLSDEDPSWHAHPGKKSAKLGNAGRDRRSSSESSSDRRYAAGQKRTSSSASSVRSGPSKIAKLTGKGGGRPIDLELVLEAFQDCVSKYKESVDSGTVRHAVDAFSASFQDQLTELIMKSKELNGMKKENTKINTAINRKRARLVEVRNELIRNEKDLREQQKENARLQERLSDLRRSTALLTDLKALQKNYLAYRQKHPDEVEVYGPSSLPALLLEARSVMGAEQQLLNINEKLQRALDQAARQ